MATGSAAVPGDLLPTPQRSADADVAKQPRSREASRYGVSL
jgi:hypothetical protein